MAARLILLLKSHVDAYTRSDGVFVPAHEDSRVPMHEGKIATPRFDGPEHEAASHDAVHNPLHHQDAERFGGAPPSRIEFERKGITHVDHRSIISPQKSLNPRKVNRIASEFDDSEADPVHLIRLADGRHVLAGGNHRTVAAAMSGRKTVKAHVIDHSELQKADHFTSAILLLKSGPGSGKKIANQAGYAFYGGRWHKITHDKPAPKGAPVAAHPEAAGKHNPAEHLAATEWQALQLPDSNVNAPSYNKALAKLKEWSDAGNVTAIVGAGYGSNTYGQKLAKIANHLLALHGSTHTVTPGQKAGSHAATLGAPAAAPAPAAAEPVISPGGEIDGPLKGMAIGATLEAKSKEQLEHIVANHPWPKIKEHAQAVLDAKHKDDPLALPTFDSALASSWLELVEGAKKAFEDKDWGKLDDFEFELEHSTSPSGLKAKAYVEKLQSMKPAAAPSTSGAGPLKMPEFQEGKKSNIIKALYEKTAQKIIDHAHAGNLQVVQDAAEPHKKMWQGKTPNSKKLLALHAEALAYAKGETKPAAGPALPPGAKVTEDVNATPMVHTTPADYAEVIKKHGFQPSSNSMYGKGVYFSSVAQTGGDGHVALNAKLKPHKQLALAKDTDVSKAFASITGLHPSYLGSEKGTQAMLDAGFGSMTFPVDDQTYTLVFDPKLIEIKDAPASAKAADPISGWKSAVSRGKVPTKAQAEAMDALSSSDEDAYMEAFMEAVTDSLGAGDLSDDAYDAALQAAHEKVYELHGKALAGVVDDGPKEGDTKPAADGGTLVLKDGHWVKQGGDKPSLAGVSASDFVGGIASEDLMMSDLEAKAKQWLKENPGKDADLSIALTDYGYTNVAAELDLPAPDDGDGFDPFADAPETESKPATLGNLSAQHLQNLQAIPWHKLKLPDTNTNAATVNKKLKAIQDAAFAGNVAQLHAMKFGSNTYGKKLALTAQTAIAALGGNATAAVPVEPAPAVQPAPVALTAKQVAGLHGWIKAGQPTSKHPDSWSNLWKKLSPGMKAAVKAELEATDQPAKAGPSPASSGSSWVFNESDPGMSGAMTLSSDDGLIAYDASMGAEFHNNESLEANDGEPALASATLYDLIHQMAAAGHRIPPLESLQKIDPTFKASDMPAGKKAKKDPAVITADTPLTLGQEQSINSLSPQDLEVLAGDDQPLPPNVKAAIKKKLAAKQAAAAPAAPVVAQSMVFHNTKEGHNKFWSVSTNGSTLMTQYGKIGAKGQKTVKQFASPAEALAESNKLMKQKQAGGYSYQGVGKHSYDAAPAADTGPKEGDTKQGADGLLVLKDGHWVKVGGDEPSAPSMDGWIQTGGQGGSNPGGKFKDSSGQEWYCKWPKDAEAIKSEVLAAKLYALAGLSSQDCMVVTKGGKTAIATKWVNIKKAGSASELAGVPGALDGFAVDAWLGNWDVVGMGLDNLQVGPDGKAHRTDAGGSLEYRAQGAKKEFGPKVNEIDTMRDAKQNPHAAAVFGKMKEADITASVAKVAAIDDAAIRALVADHGPGDEAKKKALADTLIARKNDLLARYPKAAKPGKKPLDPKKLPVDPKAIPKPHSFTNWNGQGKGLSSKDFVNKSNEAAEHQMYGLAQLGNMVAVEDFKFAELNKDTGAPTGKMLPIAQHPSKHVQQYQQDLLQVLDEAANPPQPLKVFRSTDVNSVAGLHAAFPPKKFGTTVAKVQSNEKLGFWVALGAISNPKKFKPKMLSNYSEAAINAAKQKYLTASKLAKHFISSVQASGSYNDLFRNGKTHDHQGNDLKDVAKAALAHATEMPEGTCLYRWQSMSPQMLQHIMSAKEGTVFQATGPMCTSYSATSTKGFGTHRVKIVYAKGAKAVESFASGSFAGEKEVTTLPNARFVILSKQMVPDTEHGNPGSTRLELEVLMLPPDLGIHQ